MATKPKPKKKPVTKATKPKKKKVAKRPEDKALEFIKPILPFVEKGMSVKQACSMARIPYRSAYRYIEKYDSVGTEIEYAKNVLIANATDTIATKITAHRVLHQETNMTYIKGGDSRLALEVLKRKDRESWGDNISVKSDNETTVKIDGDPTAALNSMAAKMNADPNVGSKPAKKTKKVAKKTKKA